MWLENWQEDVRENMPTFHSLEEEQLLQRYTRQDCAEQSAVPAKQSAACAMQLTAPAKQSGAGSANSRQHG